MGLDQFLRVNITTTQASITHPEAQKLQKQLANVLNTNDVDFVAYAPDDPQEAIDLDQVYDINGMPTDEYVIFNLPKTADATYRKANQIQNFFESHFYTSDYPHGDDEYNCIATKIDDVTLQHLIHIIDQVDDDPSNTKLAEKLLPTTNGFFYGGTEYGMGYYESNEQFKHDLLQLQSIRQMVNKLLEDTTLTARLIYSSWW